MKVKVIKAALKTYWYASRIGEVFEVVSTSDYHYKVINNPQLTHYYMDVKDVEIVKEESEFDMKKEAWFIPYHSHEEFNLIKSWLIAKGLSWSYGLSWAYGRVLTNTCSDGEVLKVVMWGSRPHKSAKEVKFTFKTIIDSVEYPSVETEQDKAIGELEQTIAKASEQIKQLKGETK